MSLLISRPRMGLTDMGRILSSEWIVPSSLGRAVTNDVLEDIGMSRMRKQRCRGNGLNLELK
jgi:hypothetical protein